jgi:hypothetical protein
LKTRPEKSIRICSAEDLIIHKAVAGRPQDVADIQQRSETAWQHGQE